MLKKPDATSESAWKYGDVNPVPSSRKPPLMEVRLAKGKDRVVVVRVGAASQTRADSLPAQKESAHYFIRFPVHVLCNGRLRSCVARLETLESVMGHPSDILECSKGLIEARPSVC